MSPSPSEVKAALKAWPGTRFPGFPGRKNDLEAGILVPLLFDQGLSAILTLRASHLREHAGEVCFPGGRPDPHDGSLQHTALREAQEEVGLTHCDVLGTLSSVPVYTSRYRLFPLVATAQREELRANPDEVRDILVADLRAHLDVPFITAIPFQHDGQTLFSPVFPLGGHRLFGASAHVFVELLSIVAPLLDLPLPPFEEAPFGFEELLAGA